MSYSWDSHYGELTAAQAILQQQSALNNINPFYQSSFGGLLGQAAGNVRDAFGAQAFQPGMSFPVQALPQDDFFGSIPESQRERFIERFLQARRERNMGTPGTSHLGTVKEFRKRFKEYSKADFREMGNKPVVKDILSGMTKLNKDEIKERIAEHLATV